MKKKLLLVLPIVTFLVINLNNDNNKINARVVNTKSITESQFKNYLNSYTHAITYKEKGLSDYIYTRYVFYNTRTFGERYFLNVKVDHNADLADTIITLDSFSFFGFSFTDGFGVTVEGAIPGYYCSFTSDMSLTTSTNYTINENRKFVLTKEENSTGSYYLYYRESFVDSIIVKTTLTNEFVSAEYYSSCPENTIFLELIKIRPTTDASVLPSC